MAANSRSNVHEAATGVRQSSDWKDKNKDKGNYLKDHVAPQPVNAISTILGAMTVLIMV